MLPHENGLNKSILCDISDTLKLFCGRITLPFIQCKTLYHTVKEKRMRFSMEIDILVDRQQDFRPRFLWITDLVLFRDSLIDAYDKGLVTEAFSVEFAKVFDRVPNISFHAKLRPIGIADPLSSWLESFPSGRSLIVRIRCHVSASTPIVSCFPQGLGPRATAVIHVNK